MGAMGLPVIPHRAHGALLQQVRNPGGAQRFSTAKLVYPRLFPPSPKCPGYRLRLHPGYDKPKRRSALAVVAAATSASLSPRKPAIVCRTIGNRAGSLR